MSTNRRNTAFRDSGVSLTSSFFTVRPYFQLRDRVTLRVWFWTFGDVFTETTTESYHRQATGGSRPKADGRSLGLLYQSLSDVAVDRDDAAPSNRVDVVFF